MKYYPISSLLDVNSTIRGLPYKKILAIVTIIAAITILFIVLFPRDVSLFNIIAAVFWLLIILGGSFILFERLFKGDHIKTPYLIKRLKESGRKKPIVYNVEENLFD